VLLLRAQQTLSSAAVAADLTGLLAQTWAGSNRRLFSTHR